MNIPRNHCCDDGVHYTYSDKIKTVNFNSPDEGSRQLGYDQGHASSFTSIPQVLLLATLMIFREFPFWLDNYKFFVNSSILNIDYKLNP